jgi:hypothetical protein
MSATVANSGVRARRSAAGEWITASGEWINDRTQGQQFKEVETFRGGS